MLKTGSIMFIRMSSYEFNAASFLLFSFLLSKNIPSTKLTAYSIKKKIIWKQTVVFFLFELKQMEKQVTDSQIAFFK